VTYTLGVDASRYDNEIDWKQVYAAGYRFAVIRATVGNYYTDPRFYINWDGAKNAGMLVSAYHVIVATNSAATQISRLFSVLGSRKSDFPYVFDIERKDVTNKTSNATAIQDCVNELAKNDSRRPIFYTAKYFWQDYVAPSPDWSKYDLWVASYSTKPVLPSSWTGWKFWQYSESGKVPGMGAAADVDYFNGSYADLVKYCGTQPTPAVSTTNLKAKVLASVLNIRSGPGLSYKIVSKMVKDNSVNVINIGGSDVWVQQAAGKWVAACYNGQQLLEMIPDNPFKAESKVDQLNIRSGPGTNYASVGKLKTGDVITFTAIDGKDVWIEFDLGKWSCFKMDSSQYMQLV
jgi:GH25 family lysozyme M1 (1,4-beta-N-acetylmuramidase)/uncharacterized protein YraI